MPSRAPLVQKGTANRSGSMQPDKKNNSTSRTPNAKMDKHDRTKTGLSKAVVRGEPLNSSPNTTMLFHPIGTTGATHQKRMMGTFTHSEMRQYQIQQRPPTRKIMDKQGICRGTTRAYQNHRTNWIATQAAKTLKDLPGRMQDLHNQWQGMQWTDQGDKEWMTMALKAPDMMKIWNYKTQNQHNTALNKETLVLLLEGMTKIHWQLGKPIPTLNQISDQIAETANTYAQDNITLDIGTEPFPAGDMAAVDYRLYNILIKTLTLQTELFAGALNHHPAIQSWYTARKKDTYWGGMFNSMKEPTWANMRALINPPYQQELITEMMNKLVTSIEHSTEALFVVVAPWKMLRKTHKLGDLEKMATLKTILTLPKRGYNFINIQEHYNNLKGHPNWKGCTTDIAVLMIHKCKRKYQEQDQKMYKQLEEAIFTYTKNLCPKASTNLSGQQTTWWQMEQRASNSNTNHSLSFQEITQNKPHLWENRYWNLQLLMDEMENQQDMDQNMDIPQPTPRIPLPSNPHAERNHTAGTIASKRTRQTWKKNTRQNKTGTTNAKHQDISQKAKHPHKRGVKIATLNPQHWMHKTKGDKDRPKTQEIIGLMRAEELDCLGLTGMNWTSDEEIKDFMDRLPAGYTGIGACGQEADRPGAVTGVALIIKLDPTIPTELTHIERGETGRWIAATLEQEDKPSKRLMVIYAPSGDTTDTKKPRRELIQDMHKWVNKQKDYLVATDILLIMGDFNTNLAGKLDKDKMFRTILQTTGLEQLNTAIHGSTYYSGKSRTLIDYITGNRLAKDLLMDIQVKKVEEVAPDHKLVVAHFRGSNCTTGAKKKCTRNTEIRAQKIYKSKDKHVWNRTLIDILEQMQDNPHEEPMEWSERIRMAAQRHMGRGKAKNAEQEIAFQQMGQAQKKRATLDKLNSALEQIISGENRANITGTRHTTKMILRKWKNLDQHVPQLENPDRITKEEAETLKQIMEGKEWGKRNLYSQQVNKVREDLHDHNQQTINATKAGHEYENYIMDQGKRKQQIVQMTDMQDNIQKGNKATEATAQQMQHKFQSELPGPLGQGRQEPEDIWMKQIIKESAITEEAREECNTSITGEITEEDVQSVIRTMLNRKRAGTDEETIQFYKLLFGITPPSNPEKWTELERKYQQKIAELEPFRSKTLKHILTDINKYVQALATHSWRDQQTILSTMAQEGLTELHARIHTGDIVPLAKDNGKDPKTIAAWRPIMCLNTIRKIISTIISSRVYNLTDNSMYQMLTALQFGFKKATGVPQAIYTAKLALQHMLNQGQTPIQVFVDIAAAYDSVEWDKLEEMLELKNFKPAEINLIMGLMTNMEAITSTVWGDSQPFPLKKGVPQGDSLSPIIFVIFMDAVLRILNQKGLNSSVLKHSTQGYVDDIWGLVDSVDKAKTFIMECNHILTWMGLKMNMDKTDILIHRNHPQRKQLEQQGALTWQHEGQEYSAKVIKDKESIRYLGWFMDNNMNSNEQHNHIARKLASKLAKLHMQGRCMDMWERGIKVYCNTLINHLSSIKWTNFGKHSRLQELKTMISQKYRIEGELQRDTKDCWFYASPEQGGLGTTNMEQWTLLRTILTQLKLLTTPPTPIKEIQTKLLNRSTKWKSLGQIEGAPLWELQITQDPDHPTWPELEVLRYAAAIYEVTLVASRDMSSGEITAMGIAKKGHTIQPIWDTKQIQTLLQTTAQQPYHKEIQKEQAKLKGRVMDTGATNAYLRSKYATTSWTRHLWAMRTGCINFQGKYSLEEEGKECPLCNKPISHNMTWHAILECDNQDIQDMYEDWAIKSKDQWEEIMQHLSPTERDNIERTGRGRKWRGTTERGNKWGGWMQELGDISSKQYMTIAAVKGNMAQETIMCTQRRLAIWNGKILCKYAELAGLYKGPDNGIRIVSTLQDCQKQKKQHKEEQHILEVNKEAELDLHQDKPTPPTTQNLACYNQHTTEDEQLAYEQIKRVMTQVRDYYPAGEWESMRKWKEQQHKAGMSSSSSSNWKASTGQWQGQKSAGPPMEGGHVRTKKGNLQWTNAQPLPQGSRMTSKPRTRVGQKATEGPTPFHTRGTTPYGTRSLPLPPPPHLPTTNNQGIQWNPSNGRANTSYKGGVGKESTQGLVPPKGRGKRPRGDLLREREQSLGHTTPRVLDQKPMESNTNIHMEKSGMENKGEPPALSQSNGFDAIGSH